MALEVCRDCGQEVSSTAASCPRCGRVLQRKRRGGGCLTLLAILLVAGFIGSLCEGKPTPQQTAARNEDRIRSDMELEAEMAVKSLLRDPESAKITSRVVMRNGKRTVCGTVNARNGFGGYTGETPFVGVGNGRQVMIASSDNAEAFNVLWNSRCTGTDERPKVDTRSPLERDLDRAQQATPTRR